MFHRLYNAGPTHLPGRLYHILEILARSMKHTLSQTLLHQGIAACKAGQRSDAQRILQQVVTLDPMNESAWLWLSSVVDSLEERRFCLDHILSFNPNSAHARTGMARLEQQAAQAAAPPETAPLPQQDLSDCPFCHRPMPAQRAACPHCRRDLVVVCPICEARVDVEEPVCDVCGHRLGDCSQGAAFFANLGNTYLANLKGDLAVAAWEQVLEMEPAYPDVHLWLGEAQVAAGDLEGAHASFEHAVGQASHVVSAYLGLGSIYERRHKWDEAQKVYEQAVAADESSAAAQFALGRLLMEDKALQAAFSHIRQATELDPEHAEAWFLLGQLYEMAQERRKAIRAYECASALSQHDAPDSRAASKRAAERLELFRPSLPSSITMNWPETLRQTISLAIIPSLAALVNGGLRPWQIAPLDFVGALVAALGAYFLVSATVTPRNPGMRAMLGPEGLNQPVGRVALCLLGGLFWAMGLLYILLFPLFSTM
jgi:tetratricopeptide (TPR) repeat protein